MRLQGSDRSNSSMSFRATSTTIHRLTLYAIMFIILCSNFMSHFAYLSLMWLVTFSLSRLYFELCETVVDGSA
jgi:hypothetical protein